MPMVLKALAGPIIWVVHFFLLYPGGIPAHG